MEWGKNRLDEFVIEYSYWLLMEKYPKKPNEHDPFVNRREHFDRYLDFTKPIILDQKMKTRDKSFCGTQENKGKHYSLQIFPLVGDRKVL